MPLGPNAGYKLFNTGDVLTAAQVQNNLQNQSIMFFASAAARDASAPLTAALTEGMFCYLADVNNTFFYDGAAWQAFGDLTNPTLTGPKETADISAVAATGTVNIDVLTASVQIRTVNATGNYTLNVRGNGSTTLNSLMAVGESLTVTFESPNGATGFYATSYTIDGSVVTPKYLGAVPATGNINATDVYMLQIRKTAAATFTCIASLSKFV